MARVTRGEVIAAVVAALALLAGLRLLRWGIEKGDPRLAVTYRIRRDADPSRDLVILTDEAPELIASLAPLPAVFGTGIPLRDLTPFRRLYVMAQAPGLLGPYLARFGTPSGVFGIAARRWDLEHVSTIVFDLSEQLLARATARRVGGLFDGPCPRQGNVLHCNSRDDWNYVHPDNHSMDGAMIPCVWAHPQERSQLVIEVADVPAAEMLVGGVGLDDHAAQDVHGTPVINRIHFEPNDGSRARDLEVVAPNQRGVTPYRLAMGSHGGRLSFSISTQLAGARQFCFSAYLTR